MKAILFGAALLLSLKVAARPGGGDDVGNGGGLAEKNFWMAYLNAEAYAKLCLNLSACQLDDSQRKTLSDIVAALPQEKTRAEQLHFVSEKAQPGFFVIDGQMKVAKTGSRVGDPIYVNTDLIYSKNGFGQVEAVGLPQALAILLHEFGHHVSDRPCVDLDLIGVRVSLFLQNRMQTTPLLPWNQQISALVIQPAQLNSFPQILLIVGDTMMDVSSQFKTAVFCPVINIPIPVLPVPDLQLGRQEPLGALFHNVHWEKVSKDGLAGDYTVLGNLTHVCPSGSGVFTGVNSFRARLEFSVETGSDGSKPILVEKSVRIRQSYEPWYKLIRFPWSRGS